MLSAREQLGICWKNIYCYKTKKWYRSIQFSEESRRIVDCMLLVHGTTDVEMSQNERNAEAPEL